jgi:hypothetical protein
MVGVVQWAEVRRLHVLRRDIDRRDAASQRSVRHGCIGSSDAGPRSRKSFAAPNVPTHEDD